MNAKLMTCMIQNNATSLHTLLTCGADPDSLDPAGLTLLQRATTWHRTNLINTLLAHGANVEATEDKTGCTALIFAAMGGYVDDVVTLLAAGASVNVADLKGDTALHYATAYNFAAVVDILLAYGASPDIPNKEGSTPLHVAASYYLDILPPLKYPKGIKSGIPVSHLTGFLFHRSLLREQAGPPRLGFRAKVPRWELLRWRTNGGAWPHAPQVSHELRRLNVPPARR